MSKQLEIIKRQLVILNKLSGCQKFVSKEELIDYVDRRMEERDSSGVSKRTLERDFAAIGELFGITIGYDFAHNGYYIQEADEWQKNSYDELLLNFELLTALGDEPNLHSFVLAEHHRPANHAYLGEIIKAIKSKHPLSFTYEYIRSDGYMRKKKVKPHYLKEDQHRWYLLAIDYEDETLKTFAVDAISQLEILRQEHFKRSMDIQIKDLFKYSFGIWNQEDIPIEEIEISYSPLDGKFIKRLPLHHSQIILADNEKEFRIQVTLRITNDFVMALLSRSSSLTVIRPSHLRERIKNIYQQALQRNS